MTPGAARGSAQLARGAVARSDVRRNALTGAQIDERTVGTVPSAASATAARRADDARLLAGLGPSAFVSRLRVVRAAGLTSARRIKGPIAATCPTGMRIVSGGAAVDGTSHGVALVRNEPGSSREWVASAAAYSRPIAPWRLVVTAICAAGGQ